MEVKTSDIQSVMQLILALKLHVEVLRVYTCANVAHLNRICVDRPINVECRIQMRTSGKFDESESHLLQLLALRQESTNLVHVEKVRTKLQKVGLVQSAFFN